jgi:hypothetical protein
MIETLESRELFSVTLTDAQSPTTQPITEPEPVIAEKANFHDIAFVHKIDKASPVLMH